jgi:biopolymer transport protein ExbB
MRGVQANHVRVVGSALLTLLLGLAGPSLAQESGEASAPGGGEGGAQQQEETSAREELMRAYQKEYAFLVGQKRELEQRIERFEQQSRQEVAEVEQSISALQETVLSLESDAEALQERINEMERRREAARQNADVLNATFQQAGATFSDHGRDFMNSEAYNQRPQDEQLALVFERSRGLLGDLSSIRREPGAFYAQGGGKIEGTLIHVGDIATFGVAEQAAGVLAPAGGGELKIWEQPAAETARALANGGSPEVLSLFLYDSLDSAVESTKTGGVIAKINDGGVIAWLVVGLGGIAVLLILARIVFLQRASTSTGRIVDEVGEHVRKRDLDEAIEVCRRRKGSTAAVVAAALRNIHRDREQLEDIVNEAILHESSHLERFGSLILVIAAVSPLLGLLGTVTGMISTFEVITQFGTGDPKLLSGGISIALVTTELGLIVAIPTLLIGNVLSGWADRIKDDMQKAALRVTNLYEETALRAAA